MLGTCLDNVRKTTPLVHNITNYVTVNDVANILLACGASPIMSDEPEDVEDITSICGGLNINIGTLNKNTIPSMFLAGKKANALGHIVLLDPVGAGASKLRTETAQKLLEEVKFTVIRGNISEVKTLASGSGTTKGVDADVADRVTEENLDGAVAFAKAHGYKGVIAATSGNYGAAVASQAAIQGLKCIIVQEAYDSREVGQPEIIEKARACEAMGAEVVQITVGPELFYESLSLLDSVDGANRERDYCILTLFLNCGLRISELIGLDITDIQDDALRVLGKGNKVRVVYLNSACKDALTRYMAVRRPVSGKDRNALFLSGQNRRISRSTVHALVKKHLSVAGLDSERYSSHKLRHTAATLMLQNGVDVKAVQEVLGHEHLNTTEIYTHIDNEALRVAAKANPLSGVKMKGKIKESSEETEE